MQETGTHNVESDPIGSPVSLLGDSQSKFGQLSPKLRDKLEKFGRWRIHRSSIEFPVGGREFSGGYATVSQAVLVSPSDVERQVDLSVGAESENLQGGEESKGEEEKLGAPSFKRKAVAVKKIKIERNADLERVFGLALRESGFLLELSHPSIVKLEGFIEDASKSVIWLVFPWEENGNLKDFLASGDWEIPERISLINDVTGGLEYLHTQKPPICHGDLKSLNILVSRSYHAVITDFGSARRLGNESFEKEARKEEDKPQPGSDPNTNQANVQLQAIYCDATNTITLTGNDYTIRWAAPELLKDELPCLGSDIWALGWIAYEVMTNTIPFHDVKNENIVVNRVIQGDLPSITKDARMSLIRSLCWLMEQCWGINPSKRPTAEDCRKSISWMPMIAPAARQDMDTDASKSRNAKLLTELGRMYERQGDYVNALSCYTKALDINTRTPNVTEKARALCFLSDLHLRRGELSEAVAVCSEALQIYTDADEQWCRANTLFRLAEIQRSKYEYSDSIRLYSEALQIYTDTSDRRGRALALWGLAYTYALQKEYSKATKLYSEALEIHTDIGDQREAALTQCGLAEVRHHEGEYPEAIKLYSEALEIFTNVGDQREIANTLWELAKIRQVQGEYSEAIERYSEALRIDTEIGNKSGRAESLRGLAKTHRKLDHHNEAISFYLEAAEVYEKLGDSESAADALKQVADIRGGLGEAV